MTNATNVLIIAMRPGGAVVRCRSFPNHFPDHWDDIVFFCSRNITVSDLVFEHCGRFGSGMYAYRVDGLHVRNCIYSGIYNRNALHRLLHISIQMQGILHWTLLICTMNACNGVLLLLIW